MSFVKKNAMFQLLDGRYLKQCCRAGAGAGASVDEIILRSRNRSRIYLFRLRLRSRNYRFTILSSVFYFPLNTNYLSVVSSRWGWGRMSTLHQYDTKGQGNIGKGNIGTGDQTEGRWNRNTAQLWEEQQHMNVQGTGTQIRIH